MKKRIEILTIAFFVLSLISICAIDSESIIPIITAGCSFIGMATCSVIYRKETKCC